MTKKIRARVYPKQKTKTKHNKQTNTETTAEVHWRPLVLFDFLLVLIGVCDASCPLWPRAPHQVMVGTPSTRAAPSTNEGPRHSLRENSLDPKLQHGSYMKEGGTEHIWNFRSVNTNAPCQEEDLYGEDTSYEENTAEKENCQPLDGGTRSNDHLWPEGDMKRPRNPRFHL